MRAKFVKTSNVERFLAGISTLQDRGAREAGLMLVHGDAGYGKTKTASWWALANNGVFIRLKAAVTPAWFLADLVRELGEPAPAHSSHELFNQAVRMLTREPRPIVLDEVEYAIGGRQTAVLDTARDLNDLVEVPIILAGREFVPSRLKREKQIWSRISAIAKFEPATFEDVRLMATERLEGVELGDDVLGRIHAESEGRMREVVKALKIAEGIGRRNRGRTVTLAEVGDASLTADFQRTRQAAA